MALQNKLIPQCQSLISPSSASTFSTFLTTCAHTSSPVWLKEERRETAQFKKGHTFQESKSYFVEKRMKTTSTMPTARPCEIPSGPSQRAVVISADAYTKDNKATCIQSHCFAAILALHTTSLVKMSVALYR